MLLDPSTWAAANRIGSVLARAPAALADHLTSETHACLAEIRTDPATTVAQVVTDLVALRTALGEALDRDHGLRAAVAGTHPLVCGADVTITPSSRYQEIARTMRAIAHREPTMGLHVHVGVPDPEAAVRAFDGLRAHVPALIALSASSPFWHGEDSGFASMRTPLLSMFPRMGLPRSFGRYDQWVAAVDALVASGAVPEPGFIWWGIRLQPRYGTVEVRAMDAQTRTSDTAALTALVQCLVRLHAARGADGPVLPEVLEENRFLAARDGMAARVIDPASGHRVPMLAVVGRLVERCAPIAADLGCRAELDRVDDLAHDPADARQRRIARSEGVAALPRRLAEQFVVPAPAATPV